MTLEGSKGEIRAGSKTLERSAAEPCACLKVAIGAHHRYPGSRLLHSYFDASLARLCTAPNPQAGCRSFPRRPPTRKRLLLLLPSLRLRIGPVGRASGLGARSVACLLVEPLPCFMVDHVLGFCIGPWSKTRLEADFCLLHGRRLPLIPLRQLSALWQKEDSKDQRRQEDKRKDGKGNSGPCCHSPPILSEWRVGLDRRRQT